MAQEDQAGEHRHRKGVLRFEPPDVERGDQRADDSAQGRVTAEQDGQQPGPGHHPGQIEPDGGDSAEGREVREEGRLLEARGKRIRDVRVGPDGYLYVLTDESNGELLRLSPEA